MRRPGKAVVIAGCSSVVGEGSVQATAYLAHSLVARTEALVARGGFGAPIFFVGDQMFFGQDRLHFVRDALAAS